MVPNENAAECLWGLLMCEAEHITRRLRFLGNANISFYSAPNYERIVHRCQLLTLVYCVTARGGAPMPMIGSTKDRQWLFSESTRYSSS